MKDNRWINVIRIIMKKQIMAIIIKKKNMKNEDNNVKMKA